MEKIKNSDYLFCLENVSPDDLMQMLNAQYILNEKTAGKSWTKGITSEGRRIFWSRCMIMEAAELIDSFPSWKHWKDLNIAGDELNAKIELVDIWHFLMSFLIEQLTIDAYAHSDVKENFSELSETSLKFLWESDYIKERIKKLFPELRDAVVLQQAFVGMGKDFENRVDSIAYDVTDFIETCNATARELNEIDYRTKTDRLQICFQLLITFMAMSRHFDLDLKTAYEAKNLLNEFRQLHGYKEGKYKKEWNYEGKVLEDNKVVFDRISKGVLIKDLLQDLEKLYVRA